MINASFISSAPDWPWHRQFLNEENSYEGVKFEFTGNRDDCDIVFVFDSIPQDLCGKIKARKAVFISSEPPNVKRYRDDFLSQFDAVLTVDESTVHPNKIISQVGLPWHVGVWNNDGDFLKKPMTLKDFENFEPVKTRLVSVVSSDKAFTKEHRQRLHFVNLLKAHFGSEMDFFGRNINGFADKLDVLSDYKYHVAIENCGIPHYWTEKIADPVLALTYPIYYGCPNIHEYFNSSLISRIDINEPATAIQTIEEIINSNIYEASLPKLREARQKVLLQYNLFKMLSQVAKSDIVREGAPRLLESEQFYKRNNLLRRKAKRLFRFAKSRLN